MAHVSIRPLDPDDDDEVALIARRMRLTLMEVVDETAGAEMFTAEWLRDRVRWHVNPNVCQGAVFVAEGDCEVLGHTIVRVEREGEERPFGLVSTTYVDPPSRRQGIADALLLHGEDWMRAQGMTNFATNTARTNEPLIRLYEKHGYRIVGEIAEHDMVRLGKTFA